MKRRVTTLAQASVWAAVAGLCASAAGAATPAQQQAIVQNGKDLKEQTVPVLEPGDNQVLIKVYAAAVNPVDWKMRLRETPAGGGAGGPPGGAPGAGGPPGGGAGGPPGGGAGGPPGGAPGAGGPPGGGAGGPPGGGAGPSMAMSSTKVPGMDVAGVVEKVGSGVTDLKVGDKVFSMIGRSGPAGLNGGYSQYVVAPAANVVAKPKNLTFEEAAGLGTAGMTGDRSMDQVKLTKGETVLITGVAGGVGSAAAQVALAQGAKVVGTASPRHAEFLKSIGVTDVIDYEQPDWVDKAKAKGIDVAFDTVGTANDTAKKAMSTVKKGGTFLSVAAFGAITPAMCTEAGVNCLGGGPPGAGQPSEGDILKEVGKLAGEGKFKVHVDKTYPLSKAAEAQEENQKGHTEGKIILVVDGAKAKTK